MLTEAAGLFDNERTAALIATARRLGGFDLVVIDVLSNEFADAGRDETNESMAVAFGAAVSIARALNAAVVISTHTGWSGDHTRGGSQSHGSARRVLKVENIDDVITLKVVKSNVARDLEQRRFRIVQVESDKLRDPDPRRLEEYTVLLPAERVIDDTLTTRQREVLTALNEATFDRGARFTELETYTHMPKASLSTVVNKLIHRRLVAKDARGVLTLTAAGADLARDLQNRAEKATELALNYTSQNWHVEAQNSSTTSALVHTSSLLVQSSSVDSVRSVRSLPPPLGSERSELIEQEEREAGEQRAESPTNRSPGPQREGDYDMNAVRAESPWRHRARVEVV
jgi:Mn-dependent DtxR family transcriptional regulator